MRILFLSNFYPPFVMGGFEVECREVAQELARRGHAVAVLTSRHGWTWNRRRGAAEPDGNVKVLRWLELEMTFTPLWNSVRSLAFHRQTVRHDRQQLAEAVERFHPDVLFVWGMWNLPRSLAWEAEALLGGRVVYRFADYWPTLPGQAETYWKVLPDQPLRRSLKRWLSRFALARLAGEDFPSSEPEFSHAICVSSSLKQTLLSMGVKVAHAEVIHCGIDVQEFAGEAAGEAGLAGEQERFSLLYSGRLSPEKGVETAIRAVGLLVRDGERRVSLTVLGSGEKRWEDRLRRLVEQEGLQDYVRFLARIPRQEVPAFLRQAQALVFPSTWDEPFSRVVLEAMASRLAVIASRAGGTPEVVIDGETGLLFPPGDARALADRIALLLNDAGLRRSLAEQARRLVLREYGIGRKIDAIENVLGKVVSGEEPSHLAGERLAQPAQTG